MKYIDADELYKKIDERMAKFAELEKETEPDDMDLSIFYQGKRKMCSEVINLITSLHQEQEKYVIGGQVFGATDVEQLYEGKVYIVSNLVQDTEFGLSVRDKVKMLLIKD